MYVHPILTKQEERKEHHKPFLWTHFLTIQQWARTVTERDQKATVCIVGSVLNKGVPRDIDIAIILPVLEYENRYGALPSEHNDFSDYMINVARVNRKLWYEIYQMLNFELWIDMKVCPDVWFAEKQRLVISKGA